MGTNEVVESQHHNENLFDLPLERIHLTIPVAIDTEKYSSCVSVISASKSEAMVVSAAQVKGQRWRSRSLLLSAIITMD